VATNRPSNPLQGLFFFCYEEYGDGK